MYARCRISGLQVPQSSFERHGQAYLEFFSYFEKKQIAKYHNHDIKTGVDSTL